MLLFCDYELLLSVSECVMCAVFEPGFAAHVVEFGKCVDVAIRGGCEDYEGEGSVFLWGDSVVVWDEIEDDHSASWFE